MDVKDIVFAHAEVTTKGRIAFLGLAQVLLGKDRDLLLEVLKRLKPARVKTGLIPFVAIEGCMLVGIGADLLKAPQDGLLPVSRRHCLPPGEPVAAIWSRQKVLVVSGWE